MSHLLPVIPLRDLVIFPQMNTNLFVGREHSIKALEQAYQDESLIILTAQKNADEDNPSQDDVYQIGVTAKIVQMLKMSKGTLKVLVKGVERVRLNDMHQGAWFYQSHYTSLAVDTQGISDFNKESQELLKQFEKLVKLNKKNPNDLINTISNIKDLEQLTDAISSQLILSLPDKQALLENPSLSERIQTLLGYMQVEIDQSKVEKRIRSRVRTQMEKSQREYYLNEKMKAIQKELGNVDENGVGEYEEIKKKIHEANMPKEAREKVSSELEKLKVMPPISAEANVVRGYIDWILSLPWNKKSRLKHDLAAASKILEADHYGLHDVKERILEYLAVQKRVKKISGAILCLVGPPGVGKTSLGQSIAKATGRKYVRIALGGMRDEAEIRGHRRTYIGSMPGKLVQKMAKVGVKNPLFLLDEIDKLGMDHRGDPASVLLEVLDPEQNKAFNDHFLEVDFDLSETLFICTSNSLNIPTPLLDRMEIIRIPGYTESEKLHIASRYLLPKQILANGLRPNEIHVSETAILDIIRFYTREAGVRNLERELAKICRKLVKQYTLNPPDKKQSEPLGQVESDNLTNFLGVKKFSYGIAESEDRVGQVNGLAWTQVGGDILSIEAISTPGKGKLIKTGSLGDVMQESIQAAMTVVRSRAKALAISEDFHEQHDIHIHAPEGATPKDGPSAGIAVCTALISVMTGIPVKADVAMTGEITLRGEVLPIGGLKEKLLAAHRGGIKVVLIPQENQRDLVDIPNEIKDKLDIKPVAWIDQVVDNSLQYLPQSLEAGMKVVTPSLDKSLNKSKSTNTNLNTH